MIPIEEQTAIFNVLAARSGPSKVTFDSSASVYGHDAFLLDEDYFVPRINRFLRTNDASDKRNKRAATLD